MVNISGTLVALNVNASISMDFRPQNRLEAVRYWPIRADLPCMGTSFFPTTPLAAGVLYCKLSYESYCQEQWDLPPSQVPQKQANPRARQLSCQPSSRLSPPLRRPNSPHSDATQQVQVQACQSCRRSRSWILVPTPIRWYSSSDSLG